MTTTSSLVQTTDASYNATNIRLIDAILHSQWGTIRESLRREVDESHKTFQARKASAECPNHFHHIVSSITNQVLANDVEVSGIGVESWVDDWPSLLYSIVMDGVTHGCTALGEGLTHLPRRALQVIKPKELLAHTQVYASDSALDTRIQDVWTVYSDDGTKVFRTKPRALDAELDISEQLNPSFEQLKRPCIWRFPVSIGNLLLPTFTSLFRKNSLLDVAEGNNLLPIIVVKQGPELSTPKQIRSEIQTDPSRGSRAAREARERGLMLLGADDDVKVLQTDPDFYQLSWQRVQDLEQSMYTITNTAALSTSATTHANQISGQSRSLDRLAMRQFAKRVGSSLKAFLEAYFQKLYGIRVAVSGLPIEAEVDDTRSNNNGVDSE
jgi:hypothetical protein